MLLLSLGLNMKQILIRPEDLIYYMEEENYEQFLKRIRTRNNLPENEPIWIIAEFSQQGE